MQVIICDGIGKPLEVSSDELVKAVLKHAEALFGAAAATSLSLFTELGRELPDHETVERAGVATNERLFLRHSLPKENFQVIIIYNGMKKPLKVHLEELVKTVLQKAIALFGSPPNPHTLSLFTEAGRELPDNETVKQAGLHPDEKLLLRPGAVKGGY